MHPFTLRQLQYAVAVADLRSFRRAAEKCRVAQPSLSAQLAALEDALGVRLFERDRRGVLPTAAGEELLVRARRVLAEAGDLTQAARRVGDPLAGTLRVGVIPTISPYLLPELSPPLRAAWPRLTLLWTEDKTEVLLRRLAEGALDAAVLAVVPGVEDLDRAVLAEDPFVFAAPPGHVLGALARPEDLDGAAVLLLDDGHCFRDQALAVCARSGARELQFRATSLPTLVQMVASGAGVTLLPALAVATEARRAGLVVRPFAPPAPYRTIALVWRRTSPMKEALGRLAATMRDAWPAQG